MAPFPGLPGALMLILTLLLACDLGSSSADDTAADTGISDAAGGQEGEELIGDTGDTDTDTDSTTASAALTTSSATVSFGPRLIGCPAEAALTVRNDTDTPVALDAIDTDSASDELSMSAPALPLLLAPGDSMMLSLGYAPLDEGDDRSTLTLHPDQGFDAVQIELIGEGALFSRGEDAFTADGGAAYTLTQTAVDHTLSVHIDGAPLSEGEWLFSVTEQQLLLATPPPEGAQVTIEYAVQPPSCD